MEGGAGDGAEPPAPARPGARSRAAGTEEDEEAVRRAQEQAEREAEARREELRRSAEEAAERAGRLREEAADRAHAAAEAAERLEEAKRVLLRTESEAEAAQEAADEARDAAADAARKAEVLGRAAARRGRLTRAARDLLQCAAMSFPADDRYDRMPYRRCGRSGLLLPAISLGLWHNFGHDKSIDSQRAILRRAFDLGITHFDLANNYGPPYGSAEENFGRILATDFAGLRDELLISTKAGYDMWPGPYGEWGSRKYLLSSLDQSLGRLGLDYVDVFYSHRFDPDTPLEETMGALDAAVRQGKALYAGISSYSAERTREAAAILRELGTPLLIHQPSYSMLNRWIEPELLDALGDEGVGLDRLLAARPGDALDQVPRRRAGGLARRRGPLPLDGPAHGRQRLPGSGR